MDLHKKITGHREEALRQSMQNLQKKRGVVSRWSATAYEKQVLAALDGKGFSTDFGQGLLGQGQGRDGDDGGNLHGIGGVGRVCPVIGDRAGGGRSLRAAASDYLARRYVRTVS